MAEGGDGKGLIIGVAAAAVVLAGAVFALSGKKDEAPAPAPTAAPATSPPPVAEPPPKAVEPPSPANIRVVARALIAHCAKPDQCGDAKPGPARIMVLDNFGEVGGYEYAGDAPVSIALPWGKFMLMAKDKDGFESEKKPVEIPTTGTGTITVDLTITRKPPR